MSKYSFHKYQGTGNDFIIIDNRNKQFPKEDKIIKHLCDRKFGIGSDGLILIEEDSETDFFMLFYNPDGSQSFCGNGSRCAVSFAHHLGMVGPECRFKAIDGIHKAIVNSEEIRILMGNVASIEERGEDYYINTGSPHYIHFTNDSQLLDLLDFGRKIRYSEEYKSQHGTNVNVAEISGENSIFIRTYERGVEDETLSCGTGVTACALAFGMMKGVASQNLVSKDFEVYVNTKGGALKVLFSASDTGFENIWLVGPAHFVFEGVINL